MHALGDMSVYVCGVKPGGKPLLSSSNVEIDDSLSVLSSYDALLSGSHSSSGAYERSLAPAFTKLRQANLLVPYVLAVPPPLAPANDTSFDRHLKNLFQNHEISFFWRPLAEVIATDRIAIPDRSPYAGCIVEMRTSITFPLVVRLNLKVRPGPARSLACAQTQRVGREDGWMGR